MASSDSSFCACTTARPRSTASVSLALVWVRSWRARSSGSSARRAASVRRWSAATGGTGTPRPPAGTGRSASARSISARRRSSAAARWRRALSCNCGSCYDAPPADLHADGRLSLLSRQFRLQPLAFKLARLLGRLQIRLRSALLCLGSRRDASTSASVCACCGRPSRARSSLPTGTPLALWPCPRACPRGPRSCPPACRDQSIVLTSKSGF